MEPFLAHIREGKCRQCLAFFEEVVRETKMMVYLRQIKN